MRRMLLALFALIALGAASPPTSSLPSVVVFPLSTTAALDPRTTSQIMTMLADQIAQGSEVRVVAVDPDVQRPEYLTAARKSGAQFYVTGFLTPLGDGASIVLQLVSAQSGIVVFSKSGQLTTIRDAAGEGDTLRQAILHSAARGYASFAPQQSPQGGASSPAPVHNAATTEPVANVGGLFRHKRAGAVPAPSPSPLASATP